MDQHNRSKFGNISLILPSDWYDVTEQGEPLTLVICPDGIGVLQFTEGIYQSGPKPQFNYDQLQWILGDTAKLHNFDQLSEVEKLAGLPTGMLGVAQTICQGETIYRLWYFSDGINVSFSSYTVSNIVSLDAHFREIRDADVIVQSVRFFI